MEGLFLDSDIIIVGSTLDRPVEFPVDLRPKLIKISRGEVDE